MKQEIFGNQKQADLNLYHIGQDKGVAPGRVYGPLIRDFYVIECCTQGEGVNVVNGREYSFHAGDCFVSFPGDVIIHKTCGKEERKGFFCCVKGLKIHSYLLAAGIDTEHPFVPPEAVPRVLELLKKVYAMHRENDAGAELRRNACINEIFGEILRYAVKSVDSDVYVQRAIKIIETRYGEKISVAGLAKDIGLDRCYFSTLFRKTMGVPPQRYIAEYRIKRACSLLTGSALPISESAAAVGIVPPENFSRAFKTLLGVTPGQYRAANAGQTES